MKSFYVDFIYLFIFCYSLYVDFVFIVTASKCASDLYNVVHHCSWVKV